MARLAVGGHRRTTIITLGYFRRFFHYRHSDPTIVARVDAAIGYLPNDSIVVSDRIRENFRKTVADALRNL